jgi:thymidylate kinase
MQKGRLIALYGINNLGKTTQAQLLINRLRHILPKSTDVIGMKYPLYEHQPTGPIINEYLRKGNPYGLDATSFQILQTANRMHSDHELQQRIQRGTWIVAEDYRGTGVAWGIGSGVDADLLQRLNEPLVGEDVAILLDGTRFRDSIEKGHTHEENDILVERVRQAHLQLAWKYDWVLVNANQPVEKVHQEIWQIVSARLEAVI